MNGAANDNGNGKVRFGTFELHPSQGRLLTLEGAEVKLQPQPLKVLALLVARRGEVVTREEIRQQIWGDSVFVDFEHGLNFAIKQIRTALGDDVESPRYIRTLPKRGYQFVAPVESNGHHEDVVPLPATDAPSEPARPSGWKLAGGVVAAIAFVASSLWTFVFYPARKQAELAPTSFTVAVLPFQNLTGNGEHDYIAAGLTDELISQLAQLERQKIRTISRSSVLRYVGSKTPVEQIGRELGAQHVVEGSVRQAEGRYVVTAQLVDASSQALLWSGSFERATGSVLDVQHEIAWNIGRALALRLVPLREFQNARAGTRSAEAYDAYLRGRFLQNRGNAPDPNLARQQFERAIELDPEFALAHAALAEILLSQQMDPAETNDALFREAARALELDRNLASTHATLGMAYLYRKWDYENARRHFEQALALDPSSSRTHHAYAGYFSRLGQHDRAIQMIEESRKLDPFSMNINADLGWYYFAARRYPEAVRQLKYTRTLYPESPGPGRYLLRTYAMMGDFEGVRLEALMAMNRVGASATELEQVQKGKGKEVLDAYLRWEISELTRRRDRGEYVIADAFAVDYAMLGDNDKAFEWMEPALESGSGWIVPFINIDPQLDGLRTDPRFADFVKRAPK